MFFLCQNIGHSEGVSVTNEAPSAAGRHRGLPAAPKAPPFFGLNVRWCGYYFSQDMAAVGWHNVEYNRHDNTVKLTDADPMELPALQQLGQLFKGYTAHVTADGACKCLLRGWRAWKPKRFGLSDSLKEKALPFLFGELSLALASTGDAVELAFKPNALFVAAAAPALVVQRDSLLEWRSVAVTMMILLKGVLGESHHPISVVFIAHVLFLSCMGAFTLVAPAVQRRGVGPGVEATK